MISGHHRTIVGFLPDSYWIPTGFLRPVRGTHSTRGAAASEAVLAAAALATAAGPPLWRGEPPQPVPGSRSGRHARSPARLRRRRPHRLPVLRRAAGGGGVAQALRALQRRVLLRAGVPEGALAAAQDGVRLRGGGGAGDHEGLEHPRQGAVRRGRDARRRGRVPGGLPGRGDAPAGGGRAPRARTNPICQHRHRDADRLARAPGPAAGRTHRRRAPHE